MFFGARQSLKSRFGVSVGVALVVLGLGSGFASLAVADALPENQVNPDLSLDLAQIDHLLGQNRLIEAEACLRTLLADNPQEPRYLAALQGRLGLALLRQARPADALPHLETAIRLRPDRPEFHRNLGAALMAMGRRGRGLTEYRTAIELAPTDADIRREYGQALTTLRAWTDARQELEVALDLCGGCLASHQALANLYLQSGNYESAATPLGLLWADNPTPELRKTLVNALHRSGQHQAVIEVLTSVSTQAMTVEEWRILAETDSKLGLRDRARIWTEGLKPDGTTEGVGEIPAEVVDDAHFWGVVAVNLLGGEAYNAALSASDQAIALDPDNVTYLNNKVVVLEKLGRHAQAKALWARVCELDPSLADKAP